MSAVQNIRVYGEMLCPALHHTHAEGYQETGEGLNWRVAKIVTINDLQRQKNILQLPEGQGQGDLSQNGSRK